MRVSWTTTKAESVLIDRIVTRALKETKVYKDRLECEMDIIATHANGCPLDLEKFLKAPDFDFHHDIYGIYRHIDRTTARLKDCFLPRCAVYVAANT